MSQRSLRPAFQSVELEDPIDARLEAKALEKGIPTLVSPRAEPAPPPQTMAPVQPRPEAPPRAPHSVHPEATPRSRMKPLKVDLPDYAWIALKKQVAEDMVSLRHFIMIALRDKGIPINDADMIEDGRRLR